MDMLWIWIISIIATLFIADQKKLGVVGYFFISLVIGPIAVIIALLMPDRKISSSKDSDEANILENTRRQLNDLRESMYVQEGRIRNLEILINKLSGSPIEVPFEKVIKPEISLAQPVQVSSVETRKHPYH